MRTNKDLLNDIGMIVMLIVVIVLDTVIFHSMTCIIDLFTWSLVMCVPSIMTAVVLYFVIKHFELGDKLKTWFGSIF